MSKFSCLGSGFKVSRCCLGLQDTRHWRSRPRPRQDTQILSRDWDTSQDTQHCMWMTIPGVTTNFVCMWDMIFMTVMLQYMHVSLKFFYTLHLTECRGKCGDLCLTIQCIQTTHTHTFCGSRFPTPQHPKQSKRPRWQFVYMLLMKKNLLVTQYLEKIHVLRCLFIYQYVHVTLMALIMSHVNYL